MPWIDASRQGSRVSSCGGGAVWYDTTQSRARRAIAMHVGVCKITLRLPENQSLKGKRRVVNSVVSRIRNKLNVSIAEVENNDTWQLATLGVTCATNSSRHADETLDTVVSYIEGTREDIVIVDEERETISGF